jgi:hypothetical protein
VRARLRRARLAVGLAIRAAAAVLAVGLAAAGPPRAASSQTSATGQADTTALAGVLSRLAGPGLPSLPPPAEFRPGDRTVEASARVAGPIAALAGTIHVYGTVAGDVVTYGGDIIVHGRGEITGNAIAINGRVQLDGGHIAGQSLTLVADATATPGGAGGEPSSRLMHGVLLVGGWLAVLLVISIGVLALASDSLAAVADALERHYGNALVAGLAGQVAAGPLLLALVIALVLSLLGILLVPFAVVAYIVLCAGLVMLGFLATAVVIGRGWRAAPPGSERARRASTLRAVVVGLVVLLAPWLVAALLAPWPSAEWLARGVALATTWVACTAGLGAGLISRAGIRRAQSSEAKHALASPSWQTPTPVSGVAAARRPAQTPSPGAH